jgi:hypothetical protein
MEGNATMLAAFLLDTSKCILPIQVHRLCALYPPVSFWVSMDPQLEPQSSDTFPFISDEVKEWVPQFANIVKLNESIGRNRNYVFS